MYRLPLPLGEGWGEGIYINTLILAFSQREKGFIMEKL